MSDPGIGGQRLPEEAWNLIAQYAWLRRMRGLPQRALDDRIGSSCYVEKLEAGTRNPSLKTLVEWAQALGATLVLVPIPGPQKRMPPTPSGAGLTAADLHPAPST